MLMKVNKEYQKRVEAVKLEGEKYADDAMKSIYIEQKAAMDEMHTLIGREYIAHSKDGLMVLTSAQQQQLNKSMKVKLKTMGLKLGKSEVEQVTTLLAEIFSATYYKNAFIMESGLKGNIKFNMLKKEFIDSAINAKYKGEFFSDRIWTNKASMIDHLQNSLIDAHNGKMTIDKIGREIRDRFNVTAYESQRLVRTENARVQAEASYEIGKSSGVDQVMFSSTLDGKTSEFCQEQDGKVYGIDDSSKPDVPAHPFCRSAFINVPYENWSPTNRRDNSSGEIIAYTNYEDWAKDKGI